MKERRVYKLLLTETEFSDLIVRGYKVVGQGSKVVDKDTKVVKQIKKQIKKLELPTTMNIARALEDKYSAYVIRRVLEVYHEIYWKAKRHVFEGGGKPTLRYRLI